MIFNFRCYYDTKRVPWNIYARKFWIGIHFTNIPILSHGRIDPTLADIICFLNAGSDKITEFSQDNIYENKYLRFVVTRRTMIQSASTIFHPPQIFSSSSFHAISQRFLLISLTSFPISNPSLHFTLSSKNSAKYIFSNKWNKYFFTPFYREKEESKQNYIHRNVELITM